MGVRQFIKQLFCHHDYHITKWHITHGPHDNEPRYIEGFETCVWCGKERYFTVERGSKLEDYMIEYMKERQW